MKIISYYKLLKGISKIKMLRKPVPLYCHWEVTYRCNLNCRYCWTHLSRNNWVPETSTEEALNIIAQLAEMGTSIIHFIGGEPTVRPDLKELVLCAKKKHMTTIITTNGVIPKNNRDILMFFDLIRVSIDGTKETTNNNRLSSKSIDVYEEAIKTIEFLTGRGKYPLLAATCTSKTSNEDVESLAGLARKYNCKATFNAVGAGLGYLKEFNQSDRMKRLEDIGELMVSLQDAIAFYEKLERNYASFRGSFNPSLYILKQGGLDQYGCRALDTALCLKPDGSVVLPCIEYPVKTWKNIYNLKKIYTDHLYHTASKNQGKYWFCHQCQMKCMISSTSLVSPRLFFYLLGQYYYSFFQRCKGDLSP